jgi:para-aminobenzoate synthetase component 1
MKKFVDLPQNLSWKEFIPKIEPNVICLLLKDDKNFMIGWGKTDEFRAEYQQFSFEDLQAFRDKYQDQYIFGYLGYDLKNVVEPQLKSHNSDALKFPDVYFFVPSHTLISVDGKVSYLGDLTIEEFNDLENLSAIETIKNGDISLSPLTSKEKYLTHIQKVLDHIQRGDIYEVNYCINFNANGQIDPFQTFLTLNKKTKAPFSSYFSHDDYSILSASPERFLLKTEDKLLSQPIKGTAPRSENQEEDKELARGLKADKKERAENVMIVDLVRNDLSKVAAKNTVKVPHLFEVHSFKTVHQLISTVTCKLKDKTTDSDIIKALFPMGSMTGAPKFSAMKIAEEEEEFKRGVYSGAIGAFHPNGNFDFNVVIRSILYNSKEKVISASVGGAITIKSDPEKEYQECLIKLDALQKALC